MRWGWVGRERWGGGVESTVGAAELINLFSVDRAVRIDMMNQRDIFPKSSNIIIRSY